MNSKVISVIVPIYNVEKYLKKCISSIINQTYKNLEIILVDDGSPDNCGKICDEFAEKDNRIKVIHKKNGGASAARNSGIDNASGDYLTFIDGDDYLDSDYCEKLYNAINEFNADIARCDDRTINTDGENLSLVPRFEKKFFEYNANSNFDYPYYRLSSCMLLIKKELISDDVRFLTNLVAGEDGVFTTTLILKAKKGIVYIPDKLYNIVLHNDSARQKKNNSLLEALYIREHLDLTDYAHDMWATDFVERCCIEYIQLLKENFSENKERMNLIVSYIREYKKYEHNALGEGKFPKLLFKILTVSPKLFNVIYKSKYK